MRQKPNIFYFFDLATAATVREENYLENEKLLIEAFIALCLCIVADLVNEHILLLKTDCAPYRFTELKQDKSRD